MGKVDLKWTDTDKAYRTHPLIMIWANRHILPVCVSDYVGWMSPQHAPVFVLPFARPCGI